MLIIVSDTVICQQQLTIFAIDFRVIFWYPYQLNKSSGYELSKMLDSMHKIFVLNKNKIIAFLGKCVFTL